MVVANHLGPLSPWHRTITALIVSLGEEGVWLEIVALVALGGAVGGTVGLLEDAALSLCLAPSLSPCQYCPISSSRLEASWWLWLYARTR